MVRHEVGKTGSMANLLTLPNIHISPHLVELTMKPVLKKIDRQGRIVLPASWRKEHADRDLVLVRPKGEALEILPQKSGDLTAYFDAAEVDLDEDLANWHGVRRRLRKR